MKKIILLLLLTSWIPIIHAEESFSLAISSKIPLTPDAPQDYVVGPNDSLTDVLGRFLLDPLLAADLWKQKLPEVQVGDRISLITQGDQHVLQIKRGRYVKLSPQIRLLDTARRIKIIPMESIQQFFNRPKVIAEDEMEHAGYIVATAEGAVMATTNDEVYVRGLHSMDENEEYIVVRLGQPYYDSQEAGQDGEVLIYEAIYLSDARLVEAGDPAVVKIMNADREVEVGDRLLPVEDRLFNKDFIPRFPNNIDEGRIIAVTDGTSLIGQFQVVVINRGIGDGIEEGHVLVINQLQGEIADRISGETVVLPTRRAGTIMVFRPFENVSYALVMKSTLPIRLFDEVTIP